ncbi:hypothetical protein Fot_50567 [Forsythia ovata]|uniref:Uncharacterized protein n=1 Tax=Forsythia ovata TaxID=205694 RepID=A0ABD1PYL0_9LAMI
MDDEYQNFLAELEGTGLESSTKPATLGSSAYSTSGPSCSSNANISGFKLVYWCLSISGVQFRWSPGSYAGTPVSWGPSIPLSYAPYHSPPPGSTMYTHMSGQPPTHYAMQYPPPMPPASSGVPGQYPPEYFRRVKQRVAAGKEKKRKSRQRGCSCGCVGK